MVIEVPMQVGVDGVAVVEHSVDVPTQRRGTEGFGGGRVATATVRESERATLNMRHQTREHGSGSCTVEAVTMGGHHHLFGL